MPCSYKFSRVLILEYIPLEVCSSVIIITSHVLQKAQLLHYVNQLFNDFHLSNTQKFLDEQTSANNVDSPNRKKSNLQIFGTALRFRLFWKTNTHLKFLECLKFTNHEESIFFFTVPFLMIHSHEVHSNNKYNQNMKKKLT